MRKKDIRLIKGTKPMRYLFESAMAMAPRRKINSSTSFEISSDLAFCGVSIGIYTFLKALSNVNFRNVNFRKNSTPIRLYTCCQEKFLLWPFTSWLNI
jgi:hypothetical protein